MKKYFVKFVSQLLHTTIHQAMWNFWVSIVNTFCLLGSIFFSRKLCFLWSPNLFLITESISLDTSGKPTAGFFLKITSPFWIILPISIDEHNSIWLIVEEFYCYKSFLYDKKILEVFWRIYLNIIFWILL